MAAEGTYVLGNAVYNPQCAWCEAPFWSHEEQTECADCSRKTLAERQAESDEVAELLSEGLQAWSRCGLCGKRITDAYHAGTCDECIASYLDSGREYEGE